MTPAQSLGLDQALSPMVPRHPSSLLCAQEILPRGGWSPSRVCRTGGWGRTGWLPLRGEQRTLLSQPPKELWQGHLSGDRPPPSWGWPLAPLERNCLFHPWRPGARQGPQEAKAQGLDQIGPWSSMCLKSSQLPSSFPAACVWAGPG